MSESDFGNYLANVAERDIDLLLMEEFHISPEFVDWFCSLLGMAQVEFDGAWHSVSDTDGETDLLVRVVAGGRRIGILIENKIAAPEQSAQAERYHLRGLRSREAGRVDDFTTVMCAPRRYLAGLPESSAYQHRVSYERIAAWFSTLPGARAQWRQRLLCEAVERSRRGYTMLVNEANTRFHSAYWEYLVRQHPSLVMRKPGNKGSKSNWIILKGVNFPKGVQIHHKVDQQTVELGFFRQPIDEIKARAPDLPQGALLIQKGETASIVLSVAAVDMTRDLGEQSEAIEQVLAAAKLLLPLARLLDNT